MDLKALVKEALVWDDFFYRIHVCYQTLNVTPGPRPSAMLLDSDVCTLVWEVITGFPGGYSPPGYPSPWREYIFRWSSHRHVLWVPGRHEFMELFDAWKLRFQVTVNGWRQGCKAVLSTLASDIHLGFRKIDVHDSQAQALHKAQTAPIRHFCHQKMGPFTNSDGISEPGGPDPWALISDLVWVWAYFPWY